MNYKPLIKIASKALSTDFTKVQKLGKTLGVLGDSLTKLKEDLNEIWGKK